MLKGTVAIHRHRAYLYGTEVIGHYSLSFVTCLIALMQSPSGKPCDGPKWIGRDSHILILKKRYIELE